jgi:hypothetical protein
MCVCVCMYMYMMHTLDPCTLGTSDFPGAKALFWYRFVPAWCRTYARFDGLHSVCSWRLDTDSQCLRHICFIGLLRMHTIENNMLARYMDSKVASHNKFIQFFKTLQRCIHALQTQSKQHEKAHDRLMYVCVHFLHTCVQAHALIAAKMEKNL